MTVCTGVAGSMMTEVGTARTTAAAVAVGGQAGGEFSIAALKLQPPASILVPLAVRSRD
jgi:hypothetical protein